jgi:hypothetical protein
MWNKTMNKPQTAKEKLMQKDYKGLSYSDYKTVVIKNKKLYKLVIEQKYVIELLDKIKEFDKKFGGR